MEDIFSTVRTGRAVEYFSAMESIDINITNRSGANLLHTAIAYKRIEIALDLISRGIDLNARNNEGMSALITSVISNQFKLATILVKEGADINIYDNYGNDALWYAVGSPEVDYDLIVFLLQNGAKTTHRNNVGLSSFDVANQIGDERLIKLLATDRL